MIAPWFLPGAAFLFGLVVGSFLNVVIHRLPLGESVVSPRSRCPRCGTPISPADNVPVLSWLLLRGRCRSCAEPIAVRYPLVELANGLLWAALALRFGFGLPLFVWAVFCSALLVITLIDLDHTIIPDAITLPGMVIGLGVSFGMPSRQSALAELLHHALRLDRLPGALGSVTFWDSLLALLIGGGFFYAVAEISFVLLKREGMGGGDIKLTAMLGAFLGLRDLSLAIFASLVTGSLVGIALMALGRKTRKDVIPFGPFLALGGIMAVFWGERLVDWYLSYRGY
jgi:leader peptidase (prepilin peptidase)/N-methyltransferase